MFIKALDNPREYDVFLGSGWTNWIRVKFINNGVEVVKKSVEEIEPATLSLIFYKIKRLRRKKG